MSRLVSVVVNKNALTRREAAGFVECVPSQQQVRMRVDDAERLMGAERGTPGLRVDERGLDSVLVANTDRVASRITAKSRGFFSV